MTNKKGFTLIEMLIVVAVVGILASLVLVGLGPVQRQGRDARRISDLRQVQNGLELYFIKNGDYPLSQAWTDLANELVGAGIGVPNIPVDPNNTGSYVYQYGSDGSSYVLKALLEDKGSKRLQDDFDGTGDASFQLDCDDTSAPNYCIKF